MSVSKTSNPLDVTAEHISSQASSDPQPSSSVHGCDHPPRFVRLNPRYDAAETLELLSKELNKSCGSIGAAVPVPVTWVDSRQSKLGFYSLPNSFPLSKSESFRSGRVYGMDVSSGAAVSALLSQNENDTENRDFSAGRMKVLDLCCCPGLKMCAIADLLEQRRQQLLNSCEVSAETSDRVRDTIPPGAGDIQRKDVLVGVDVSPDRIATCKSVLQKYFINGDTSGWTSDSNASHPICRASREQARKGQDKKQTNFAMPRIQLYCTDGTTFGHFEAPDTQVSDRPTISQQESSCGHHQGNTVLSIASLHGRNLVFDSKCALEEEAEILSRTTSGHTKRRRSNKSSRAREQRRLRSIVTNDAPDVPGDGIVVQSIPADVCSSDITSFAGFVGPVETFDLVLVDAECSTDGAVRHLAHKFKRGLGLGTSLTFSNGNVSRTSGKLNQTLTRNEVFNLSELIDLQRRLILSGFRLLKRGGSMVYSTCSMCKEQNEGVVSYLLREESSAYLIPTSFPEAVQIVGLSAKNKQLDSDKYDDHCNISMPLSAGDLPGTLRFHPNTGGWKESYSKLFGGGFFLAKIGKGDKDSDVF